MLNERMTEKKMKKGRIENNTLKMKLKKMRTKMDTIKATSEELRTENDKLIEAMAKDKAQVSISSTFQARLFVCKSFSLITVWICNIEATELVQKLLVKCFMKLTTQER